MIPVLAARMARRLSQLCSVGIALGICGCALLFPKPNVMLSGQEQVPAVATTGFGMGRIAVNKDRKVSGSIKITGVEVTAAHIHMGAVGKIGPPIVTLNKTSSAVWAVPIDTAFSSSQMSSYLAGELYINVHSTKYKGGEIRGQLRPE
jgi:CHRD domain